MSHRLFILDVSGYIFRAYYALPHMSSPSGEPTHALYGFIRSIIKIFKEFAPKHMVAVFDGPDNKRQRKEIYEKYKSNRTTILEDLPEQLERVKEFCVLVGIPHVEVPGVEADDTMGSIAVWAAEEGHEVMLCTSDKDLCQLVSKKIKVLNTWKNIVVDAAMVEELYGVPPQLIVDLLAIMGDSSDNIPGLKGFGPKTAVPLLKEFGSLENLLQHPEKVKGAKKQETLREEGDIARLSQRLATIHTDIDFPKDSSLFALQESAVAELKQFYLSMGFNTLVRDLDTMHESVEKKNSYHLVDDEHSLLQLIKKLEEAKEIAFDLEATDVRPMLAEPVGIGFCVKQAEAYYVPFNGTLGKAYVLKTLKPLFQKSSFFGHNVKYDCHVLANVGIDIEHICFDTILAAYLLNSASRRHSLDALSLQYFGKVKTPIKDLIGSGKKEISMDLVPIGKVADYCCEDVDYTFRLKQIFAKEIDKRGFSQLLTEMELPLSRVLIEMERTGMYLDVEKLKVLSKEIERELKSVESKIYDMAGEEFNISSPKQLSHILFTKLQIKPLKKNATGLSTRAEVLEELAFDYPIAEEILAFRTLDKLRSTYIETLQQEVNPQTKRVHPTFSQFSTATGRLACQDPNLQNIPVRTPQGRRIREAFCPERKGWLYLTADYSQVELRLLAHLSEDDNLIKAFEAGEDIHAYTASLMFAVPLSKVSKTQRHQAKAINFGIIYGQQAYGLSRELKIDVHDAKIFIEAYFERYPKVATYIDKCIKEAKEKGFAITMAGRERMIPEITSNNAIARNAAERLAINTPLQGSAADMIKLAMLDIAAILCEKKMATMMILQVHDELIFETPESEITELKKIVKNCLEGVFSLKVPLVVDIHVGKNWGEC
ncbi:MAG: DNA polymerase I [Chlamydiales bacterium]